MIKLDIGCGNDKKQGFIGIDKMKYPCVDYVMDARNDLPFKDVTEVRMKHFLEHLDIDEIRILLKRLEKMCVAGCVIEIFVPHFSGFSAFDVDHKTFFRTDSFEEKHIFAGDFYTVKEKKIRFEKKWCYFWNYLVEMLVNKGALRRVYEKTCLRNIFPSYEIRFVLVVK